MLRYSSALLAVGLAAAVLAPTAASAEVKHRVHHYARTVHRVPDRAYFVDSRPPLEVNRRSWLDPGPVVPQGSMQRYVEAVTTLSLNNTQMYTDFFGNSTLPRRFDPPGRPVPVVEFWTPAYWDYSR
jgi:hypothetical protein